MPQQGQKETIWPRGEPHFKDLRGIFLGRGGSHTSKISEAYSSAKREYWIQRSHPLHTVSVPEAVQYHPLISTIQPTATAAIECSQMLYRYRNSIKAQEGLTPTRS